jgi:hypothetical protein
MKNIKLVTAGIILSFFTLLSSQENGDLAEVELLSSMSQQQAQFQLNAIFGSVAPTAEYDISVYRIEYHTIDPLGEPTVASGSIAFPQDPQTAFPILSYQHGTEVLRDDVSSVYGFDAINMWLSATGFITVSPDYLGLGISEMLHPYIINIPTATAVAHFLIASKTFCDDMDDLQYNDQLFLMGYSEGGYATMAAHKYLEDNYAGELPVTLSTPMAGPYDLSGVTLETILSGTEYDQPYYVAYILLAYIEHYQMGELNEFLTDYYASLLPGLFDGTHPSWQINSYLPSTPLDILRPEVLDELINDDNHIFRTVMEQNDIYDWHPESPIYLYHGLGDELVPPENSQIAYDVLIANGAETYLQLFPASLGGHGEVAIFCIMAASVAIYDNSHFNFQGDINSDLVIDVLDIVLMVQFILSSDGFDSYELWASDINSDGIIDVLDIVQIINVILYEE